MRSGHWIRRLALAAALLAMGEGAHARRDNRALVAFGVDRIPLHFTETTADDAGRGVRFEAHTAAGSVLLTSQSLVVAADGPPVRIAFVGAETAQMQPVGPLPARVNYYRGRDPATWRTNVATYARVRYQRVYPDIDVLVYGARDGLEYDFVVAPRGDVRRIALEIDGVERLSLDAQGDLVLARAGPPIVQRAPVIYQERDGRRRRIAGRYVLRGANRVGFEIGEYDRTLPLVIDPVIVYASRVGVGVGRRVAVDAEGAVYVTGENAVPGGAGFPLVKSAFPHQPNGYEDVFVTKIAPDGRSIVYSTFIGSFWRDFVNGIAVDDEGNAYIAGKTHPDFPTTPGALQPTAVGGEDPTTPFVAKFGAAGALVYSTFLQGSTFDGEPLRGNNCVTGAANGIAVDAGGSAYVTGVTKTNNFPTTAGAHLARPPRAASSNCFASGGAWVAKLAANGRSLIYSTYLDGAGSAIAVSAGGDAFVAGPLAAATFKTYSVAAGRAATGGAVVKLDGHGRPVYGTIIGPVAGSIAVGADGSAYVAGTLGGARESPNSGFSALRGFQTTPSGGIDGFAGRLHPTGASWIWSTYVGGAARDAIAGIAVHVDGRAWLVGSTASADFPTRRPLRRTAAAVEIAALAISPTGALDFASVLGEGQGYGIAVDRWGDAYITGVAGSDFPATPVADSPTAPPPSTVFIMKVSPTE
jgi:hypothetical protein